jgi:hypothetical protein
MDVNDLEIKTDYMLLPFKITTDNDKYVFYGNFKPIFSTIIVIFVY